MREIKFRAWNSEEKIMANVGDWNWTGKVHVSYKVGEEKPNHFFGGNSVGADWNKENYILMQYTGLKDKNGKEIYDGDKFPGEDNGEYYLVEWNDNESRFQVNLYGFDVHIGEGSQEVYDDEISKVDDNVFEMSELIEMEIIGNIYETPELLVNA